ncbi:large subunit GTPase 1 homolog [Scylla paramamosain]|uniref:large subunit GTPase 1 homolog n=1 Tax=Scylla paramamosain TaxID=85552 RepID=UPI0030832594
MGKKNGTSSLGRSLMKDRHTKKNKVGTSLLHTSEINDGQEWNRLNLQSITEQTHVDEFLATAELAGTEFQAEKLNIKFVRPTTQIGMLTEEEKRKIRAAQEANREMLSIPRRPPWNVTTTPEQLAEAERSSFLSWRRNLAKLQEVEGITLTPFERNLEFWRQLWRVIERSDVVVQIMDARNPLLFRCEDLEAYVKEVDPNKENLLLVNKSDFLTEAQREMWARYFREEGIKAVFFSALSGEELDTIREEEEKARNTMEDQENRRRLDSETNESEETQTANIEECRQDLEALTVNLKKQSVSVPPCQSEGGESNVAAEDTSSPSSSSESQPSSFVTSSKLLSRSELIEVFRTMYTKRRLLGRAVTIGLVGYPNVGKSSTINCLMQGKKVSVSATPGKTKHFQTLYLADDILLCDCPGLVFPAFVTTKQEMIISGILPIDQMRDEVAPINLVTSRIPRDVLEHTYGITLPKPLEGEDSNRPPTSEELLNSYGFMRGFMTQRGMPDNPRSARYILKDFVNGKLLYAHAPPSVLQAEYHTHTVSQMKKHRGQMRLTPQQIATQPYKVKPEAIDVKFFGAATPQYHIKGINTGGMIQTKNGPVAARQPRQKNFKKREKLRRRFAHLDE